MSAKLDRQVSAMDAEAKRFGIACGQEIRSGVNRYRWDIIERDAQKFLGRRRDVPAKPGTNTFPEALVNYMAAIYLSCVRLEGVVLPEPVLHLASQQLGIFSIGTRGAAEKSAELEKVVAAINAQPNISDSELARLAGVDRKTIRRWKTEGLLVPEAGT